MSPRGPLASVALLLALPATVPAAQADVTMLGEAGKSGGGAGIRWERNFEDALRKARAARKPLLVDFWAPWCGPCLMAAPIVKAVGARMAGQIVVLAVDTEAAPEAGEQHVIYAIPTFAVFRNGEEIARQMGGLAPGELERWVLGVLAPGAEARA